MIDLLVIAHGKRNGRLAAPLWNRILRALRRTAARVELRFTNAPGHATSIAREAVLSGVPWIAVAGGDGTINEVLNGFRSGEGDPERRPALSFLPFGSGNDWVRTLGMPRHPLKAAESLAASRVRLVDAGLARFSDFAGQPQERLFMNFAEAGVGARSVQPMNSLPQWGRRGPVYLATAVATAFRYAPRPIEIACDGEPVRSTDPLLSVIVANGRFFGAGIQCAPMADIGDGMFDTITIGSFGKIEVIRKIRKFVAGRYLDERLVSHRAARTIEISAATTVPFQLDGDCVGFLPAIISVLPGYMRIRY
jgi:diacylglycerol kinase (ATP)